MASIFGDIGNQLKWANRSEYSRHKIKVVGVGGGGGNTVNHMYRKGGVEVDYAICNTDKQALDASPVPEKLQLGPQTTGGLGAGYKPEVGLAAAQESIDDIRSLFPDETEMVFVTAGMGGGTGTGAAPIIARTAKDLGKLTIGIVTTPFKFECRDQKASAGIDQMRQAVDSLIVVNNERIFDMYGDDQVDDTFAIVDEILCAAASNIAGVINKSLKVNVDLADIRTLLTDSGTALLGSGSASGPDRVKRVTEQALTSPLLNNADIYGAKGFIFTIKYGANGFRARELNEMAGVIRERSGNDSPVKWGMGLDESLAPDELSLMVIAAGFPSGESSDSFRNEIGTEPRFSSLAPQGPETPIDSPADTRTGQYTQERTLPNGERKVFTIHTLELDDEDLSVPELSGASIAFSAYVGAPAGQTEETRRLPYERRPAKTASPLESDIEDVLSDETRRAKPAAHANTYPQTGRTGSNANRDTEPAYLRHGITIETNPPKEGRTHVWTLDTDD